MPPTGKVYQFKVDKPDALNVPVAPAQMPALVVVGAGSPAPKLVMDVVPETVQPAQDSVTTAVYIVVPSTGVDTGLATEVEERPVAGDHA